MIAQRPASRAGAAKEPRIPPADVAELLNGKEPKELEKVLGQFDQALDSRDRDAARDEAGRLAAQVPKLIGKGDVDAEAGTRLATAADRLEMAARALPD